jgi:hypothetical protein
MDECCDLGIQRRTAFWVRAAGTLGAGYTVAPELAADVVDEFLELFSDPQMAASSPGFAELRLPRRSIHLHATDTDPGLAADWRIELGTDGFTWRRGHEQGTVALRGPIADVLRVVHRRLPAGSDRVHGAGDAALLDSWLARVSLNWGRRGDEAVADLEVDVQDRPCVRCGR